MARLHLLVKKTNSESRIYFKKGLTIENGVKHSRLNVLGALVGCLVLTLLVP